MKLGPRLLFLAQLLVVVVASEAAAQPAGDQPPALAEKIAILRLEALGMDPEPVSRLEALFRMELERLAGHPLPTRRQIDSVIRKSRSLRKCGTSDKCLAKIGKALGVDLMVTGNVAALGDSYIISIKVVEVASAEQRGEPISSEPLRGSPDQLIEAVRTAAYTLLAPDQVRGSIMVLSDLVGAAIKLNGELVGTTPLTRPLADLRPGKYQLSVESSGYQPFVEEVVVRFQKTTRVVVRLAPEQPDSSNPVVAPVIVKKKRPPKPWYSSTWVYIGAGVTAAILGGYIGYRLARDPVIDCTANPDLCAR